MGGRRRRRHTKKHKRHSRRRHTRGGFTAASYDGELVPGIAKWTGPSVSGPEPVIVGYGGAPSTMKAYGGGRRSRKTRRRHRRRSMRGGTGGEGVGYGFREALTSSGPGVGQRVYEGAGTGNHTVDANGYNGAHP